MSKYYEKYYGLVSPDFVVSSWKIESHVWVSKNKLATILNFVQCVRCDARQRGLRAHIPTCHCAKKFSTSYFYVPTFQLANKCVNVPTCQKRGNFLTWFAKVPKGVTISQLCLPESVPIFHLFFKRNFFLNFKIFNYG